MKVAIGSDHAGFDMKEVIIEYLKENNHEVVDMGTYSTESVDYPDFAKKVGEAVVDKEVDYGILMCGSGIGISIAANKVKGVRAALCFYPTMAELSRKHNDANVLVMAGRLMGYDVAKWTVSKFLSTKFEGGRHQRRVDKITKIEE